MKYVCNECVLVYINYMYEYNAICLMKIIALHRWYLICDIIDYLYTICIKLDKYVSKYIEISIYISI